MSNLTAFATARLVNEGLKEAGLDVSIPPQMVYNYTTGRIAKGKAPLIEVVTIATQDDEGNVTEQVRIDEKVAKRWAREYVTKRVAKEQAAAEEVEAELEGAASE